MSRSQNGLKLTDVLVTIVVAIVFGLIYKVWGPLYSFAATLGLHIDQLIYGMWFMAGTVAYLLIRKPGLALLAEIAAASGEFLTGSQWGLEVLIYGVIQGLLAELVFLLFRYKRYDILVVSLASIGSAAGSIAMDWYKGYIGDLAPWNLTLYLVARLIGSVLISGVFAYYLVKALEQTGVTGMLRPISKKEYDSLDQ
ncbi:ECF transporter S component [Falsibacillus pallidus]|uniref:Energy-coupling factor transport system substrate-specific component n=1 Tax=Falsibacillus pallidus TaxID=493781 RepID=A0A370G7Z6_9BACI|nr:ECF transporter S component [Falsibacillus pallidus]RDI39911.1 energy-coupling factor transport system substrate-specific component [Falsibacillus pallidus]